MQLFGEEFEKYVENGSRDPDEMRAIRNRPTKKPVAAILSIK
jgi:hypothetical protein